MNLFLQNIIPHIWLFVIKSNQFGEKRMKEVYPGK